VELDFSRKGSTAPRSGSFSTAGNLLGAGSSSAGGATPITPGLLTAASTRTIAASLTCCRHCGLAYLDNYVGLLTCRASPPTVDFRGQLASRHSAIVGWSLTSYLKTLHSGGYAVGVLRLVGCVCCVLCGLQQEDTVHVGALRVVWAELQGVPPD
jgi:hypothetical protein